jgi:serine/threonine protein kinase
VTERPTSEKGTAESPSAHLVGAVLASRYQLTAIIGEGGHGIAYQARDLQSGQLVVAKVSRKIGDLDRGRIQREASHLQRLRDAHVVPYHDGGQTTDGLHFLISAYVRGASLATLMESSPLDVGAAMATGAAIAGALAAVHESGALHRDVKPGNVIVPYSDVGEALYDAAVLLDFGVARAMDRRDRRGARRTQSTWSGTALYMAPEQARGWPQTEATDMYGLGALIFAVLYGYPPQAQDGQAVFFELPDFGNAVKFSVVPERLHQEVELPATPVLPETFANLLRHLLRHDPHLRNNCASRVQDDLTRLRRSYWP